jgi:hypothetical protein
MKRNALTLIAALAMLAASHAQTLVNLGLVGVGRIPADSFDQLGPGVDTLGGVFSGIWVDPSSITKTGDTYYATIYAQPDRGFGDGAQAYHPRLQQFAFSISPYYGTGPVAQGQITLSNTATMLYTVGGNLFTGYDPTDTNAIVFPTSLPASIGGGLLSLDPEGLGHAPDGSWYVSDEYGPYIYHFDSFGVLLEALVPPDAFLPKIGTNYPRATNFFATLTATTDSGRYNNRGFEGLSITPDGRKLVTVLQSPLQQDGENRNPSRNTRILVYDIDPLSPTYHRPIAEYVHSLPLSAAEANNRHTLLCDVLALSDTKFLLLQRDNRGRGGDLGTQLYKRVVTVDVSAASNILGTGYDLEKGAPGHIALPRSTIPTNITVAASQDLVNMLNVSQLAKFGLNVAPTNQNNNTLPDKWEGLARLPLNDPAAPSDYLLLVGTDNDFRASFVFHNGVIVGTNADFANDTMLLAFRIGEDHIAPTLTCPGSATVAATATCRLPSVVNLVTATDNSAAPITLTQSPAAGSSVPLNTPVPVTITATDAAGNVSPSCVINVTVVDQTKPAVVVPTNIVVNAASGSCFATVNYTASASDNCGVASFVCTPPSGSAFATGTNVVTCTATDNSGNTTTATFRIIVRDTQQPVFSLPANITVNTDAGQCSAVVNYTASASDNCSIASFVCTPASGSVFARGTTTVNCTATDASGNVTSGSFTITVVDAEAPTIASATPSSTPLWRPNHKFVPVTVSVSATDNCDASVTSEIISVTSNEAVNAPTSPGATITTPDWNITGPLSVALRAERIESGSGRIYTITVQTRDSVGNSSTAQVFVTVPLTKP